MSSAHLNIFFYPLIKFVSINYCIYSFCQASHHCEFISISKVNYWVLGRGRCSSGSPEMMASLTAFASSSSVFPSDSIGSCTTTLHTLWAGLKGNIQYEGMTFAAPQIEMGTTGFPALCAILKAPFLNGMRRPDRDRVPSGNVQRFTPSYTAKMQ